MLRSLQMLGYLLLTCRFRELREENLGLHVSYNLLLELSVISRT